MKIEKMSLKGIKNMLSRDEMKRIMAGSSSSGGGGNGGGGGPGGPCDNECTTNADCSGSTPHCVSVSVYPPGTCPSNVTICSV